MVTVIATLLAAILGAGVGGTFVILSQWQESRRQKAGATRALLIEVRENAKLARDMMPIVRNQQPFASEGPSPQFLSRRIWDSQLPLVAQLLDPETLQLLAETYIKADVLFRSRLDDGTYPHTQPNGKWFDEWLLRTFEGFEKGEALIRAKLEADRRLTSWQNLWRALSSTFSDR